MAERNYMPTEVAAVHATQNIVRASIATLERKGTYLGLFALLFGWIAFAGYIGFSTDLPPVGDHASNDMLIHQAKSGLLLHGNYSRVGVYHPGPFFQYVELLGEILFRDLTRITAGVFPAHTMGIALLNVSLIVAVAAMLRDLSGRRYGAIAAALAGTCVLVLNAPTVLASLWPPHTYMFPAYAFAVGCATLASGRGEWLWLTVATGGMLVHGHASFFAIVPITFLVSASLGLAAGVWTRRAGVAQGRIWLAHNWRKVVLAVLVGAAFLLPIVLDILLNFPGEIAKYLRFSQDQPDHPISASIGYLAQYWTYGWIGLPLLLVGALDRSGENRAIRLPVVSVVIGLSAAALYYTISSVDTLAEGYICLWYSAAPALAVSGAVLCAAELSKRLMPAIVAVSVACGSSLLLVTAAKQPDRPLLAWTDVAQTVAAVTRSESAALGGTPIQLVLDNKSGIADGRDAWVSTWTGVAGALALMERAGARWFCVSPESWHLLMHVRNRCATNVTRVLEGDVVLGVTLDVLAPKGAEVLHTAGGVSIFRISPGRSPTGLADVDWFSQIEGGGIEFAEGWSVQEPTHRWSSARYAVLKVPRPAAREGIVTLVLEGFCPAGAPPLDLVVRVDGVVVASRRLTAETGTITVEGIFDPGAAGAPDIIISLETNEVRRPVDYGVNTDERMLGVMLKDAHVK